MLMAKPFAAVDNNQPTDATSRRWQPANPCPTFKSWPFV